MRLREIMVTPVVTIGPNETADTAWSRMEFERIRHLVVMDGKRLLGVISDRDLGGREGTSVREGRTVGDLMTPQVAIAKPDTTLRQAANLMSGRLIGCLPVVEGDRVVGIVTATDVLDELGRGSSRPTVRAQRQSMRLPPAGARAAARKKAAGKRATRATSRIKKTGPAGETAAGDIDDESREPATTRRSTPGRTSRPDSPKRAPLPKSVPKAQKREVGRGVPTAYIRSIGGVLDDEDRDYLRRKLGRKLGKFASTIERTSVRVEDVNGPRGGVDKRCRIKVVLSGLPSIVVEERSDSLQAAMDGALAGIERAVRHAVDRRRTKPLRQ